MYKSMPDGDYFYGLKGGVIMTTTTTSADTTLIRLRNQIFESQPAKKKKNPKFKAIHHLKSFTVSD
ncbi:hypothetical protein CVS40_6627 [Lucilia cuprina]|nr:hypothetical protein CVS40_6627 [Lucilia cuprina]